MIEPKQMDEHTAERILGHLLCWDPRDVRVDHQERQKRDLSAGKAVRAFAAAEARANATVGTHYLDALVLNPRLIVACHRARAALSRASYYFIILTNATLTLPYYSPKKSKTN